MAWYCIIKDKDPIFILDSLTQVKEKFPNIEKDHICNNKMVYKTKLGNETVWIYGSKSNAIDDGFQKEISIKYKGVILTPEDDGITHINIYSKAKTEIGRVMTNVYVENVETEDGVFPSVETYWHWFGVKNEYKDEIKNLSGFAAQKRGRFLKRTYGYDKSLSEEEFQKKIYNAVVSKGLKHLDLFKGLDKENTIFVHYYDIYGNIVDKTDKSKPLIDACYYLLEIC